LRDLPGLWGEDRLRGLDSLFGSYQRAFPHVNLDLAHLGTNCTPICG
jgi:hypothetical protein